MTPPREFSNDELLSEAGADPFRSADCEISKYKTNAAIRSGKVKIIEAGCCQVTAHAGVVRHLLSAVTPGDKWAEHRMPDSRAGGACSLIEVTGILMEQGRKYGAADHNVGEATRRSCAQALAISTPPLAVVGTIRRLPDTGHAKNPGSGNRIDRHLQGELKFHLRGEWCRILLIRDIEVSR